MATTKIRKTAGICNGADCIGRTQIPVWKLITLYADGCSEASLLSDYPELTKDDLKAARNYYAQNPVEIDEAMVAERKRNAWSKSIPPSASRLKTWTFNAYLISTS